MINRPKEKKMLNSSKSVLEPAIRVQLTKLTIFIGKIRNTLLGQNSN